MKRFIGMGLIALALVACDNETNPLTGPGSDTDDGASTSSNEIYQGEMNNLVFDATTGEIIINNLPFDGVDGRYADTGIVTVPGFGVYESQTTGETGQFQYMAVYAEGTYTRAGAAGTGDYASFGHGGTMIATDGGAVAMPIMRGELIYTGDYAGIRVLDENAGNDLLLTRGNATLIVDLLDFDVDGAILGSISGHELLDMNGNVIGTLPGIALNETSIGADGTIAEGTTTTYDSDGDPLETGTWGGKFAGPDGEEIVGYVIMTGDNGESTDVDAMERGVFIVVD
ncbi:hypothetical protein [Aliiroseovarius sp.]|uniref:hypothetical protein n=1 Tax=Aliiroseovarius sp. TaxID=1872442 RepID=UPI003BACD43A